MIRLCQNHRLFYQTLLCSTSAGSRRLVHCVFTAKYQTTTIADDPAEDQSRLLVFTLRETDVASQKNTVLLNYIHLC